MLGIDLKRLLAIVANLSLLFTTTGGALNAAMVGTQTALHEGQRAEYASDIQEFLDREQVREQLVAMGVEPAAASERVADMTTGELRLLNDRIEAMPAGAGVIEVIGVVFLVLLILELVGVTNIFSGF